MTCVVGCGCGAVLAGCVTDQNGEGLGHATISVDVDPCGNVSSESLSHSICTTDSLFVAFDEPPQPTHLERAEYPEEMLQYECNGHVIVQVTIDRDGRVCEARVVESTLRAAAQRAAIEAALLCRFSPARHHGVPVPARIFLPFVFRSNNP